MDVSAAAQRARTPLWRQVCPTTGKFQVRGAAHGGFSPCVSAECTSSRVSVRYELNLQRIHCFLSTGWETFAQHTGWEDLCSSFLSKTIRVFHNQEPRFNGNARSLLTALGAAYRSGDGLPCRKAQSELNSALAETSSLNTSFSSLVGYKRDFSEKSQNYIQQHLVGEERRFSVSLVSLTAESHNNVITHPPVTVMRSETGTGFFH